jgi:hypothetical protein
MTPSAVEVDVGGEEDVWKGGKLKDWSPARVASGPVTSSRR